MFEHFNTPEEIFSFKLGSALTAEHDSLAMLEQLAATTRRPELKTLFDEHAAETRHQIENLQKAFALLGEEVNDSPSPTTKGLTKEGAATIKKTDPSIVDAVLLSKLQCTRFWSPTRRRAARTTSRRSSRKTSPRR
jgi:ferritin-like metal-binding protein YciE